MRHFYLRSIFGIIWMAVAAVSVVKANLSSAALYVVMGIVFLWSSYSIWKMGRNRDNDRKCNDRQHNG